MQEEGLLVVSPQRGPSPAGAILELVHREGPLATKMVELVVMVLLMI